MAAGAGLLTRHWRGKTMPRLNQEKLNNGIKERVRAAGQEGRGITGGDQNRIQLAVSVFVNKNFTARYDSQVPPVKDLPEILETTVQKFSESILVSDECMKKLCRQLAEWINANYQRVPNTPWRGIGRRT